MGLCIAQDVNLISDVVEVIFITQVDHFDIDILIDGWKHGEM